MTGQVKASMDAVKSKGFFDEFRSSPINALTGVFQLAFSKQQQEQLETSQKEEKRQFEIKLAEEQKKVAEKLRIETEVKKRDRLQRYQTERNDLLLTQKMEAAKMRAEWQELQKERRVFLEQLPSPVPEHRKPPSIRPEFERAVTSTSETKQGEGGSKEPEHTKTHDQSIAEKLAAMKARDENRDQNRDQDQGHER